jgi:hypothetical protein
VLIGLVQGAAIVIATGSFSKVLAATYQWEINTTTTIISFLMVPSSRHSDP